MLLNELITNKRGSLAKIWQTAHQERKLNKQQTLSIDVGESVDAILANEDGPLVLRTNGVLMLGVTRIYSRKVQYLLDDCKETRDRISLAFRPGIVDLPEDQIKASKAAITFQDIRNDFDFYDWTWNAPPLPSLSDSQSRILKSNQLALKPQNKEFGAYNFGRPAAPSLYGGSTSRHASHDDSTSHLDSQDFSGIDLDLRLDDFAPGSQTGRGEEGDMSIEAGRHVSRENSIRSFGRAGSAFGSNGGARNSLGGIDDGFNGDFGQVDLDLGLDLPDSFGLPGLDSDSRKRREGSTASSALSTPPPQSPPDVTITDLTPRTAAKIAQYPTPSKQKRAVKKQRLMIIDQEIELDDSYFTNPQPGSSLFRSNLPSNKAEEEGFEVDDFLPVSKKDGKEYFYAGPPGIGEELKEMFMFPIDFLRKDKSSRTQEDEEIARANKRPRIEGGEDMEEDIELGRRQSTLPLDQNFDLGGGTGFDDSFNLDLGDNNIRGEFDITPTKRHNLQQDISFRAPSLAPSRAESMARQIQFGESDNQDYTLAIFDNRTSASSAAANAESLQSTPSKSGSTSTNNPIGLEARTKGGYSKNTGMAMGLLRRELEKIEEEELSSSKKGRGKNDKEVKFEELAKGASKRAAASFFFELLVLGTRDCVKLDQKKAFGDLSIRGKDKLWDEITV